MVAGIRTAGETWASSFEGRDGRLVFTVTRVSYPPNRILCYVDEFFFRESRLHPVDKPSGKEHFELPA